MAELLLVLSVLGYTPEVKFGGTFYTYSFFWNNADFDTATKDVDQYFYIHGDITANLDFGEGVKGKIKAGAWGTYGFIGPMGLPNGGNPRLTLLEAYITVDNFLKTPFTFTIGKKRTLFGDGITIFDGGEEGLVQTGLSYSTELFSTYIFNIRAAEYGGLEKAGMELDSIPSDIDIPGIYNTVKFENLSFDIYGFARLHGKDRPLWGGLRTTGTPLEGLSYTLEFTQMLGKDETSDTAINYKGNAGLLKLSYALPQLPLTFGGGVIYFSGDKENTRDDEGYQSISHGPFTYGFHNWWPGLGPAHNMKTAYGFSLLAPYNELLINTLNFHVFVKYSFEEFADFRIDFYNYNKNEVPEGVEKAMGNEVAIFALFKTNPGVNFGLGLGYWIPGKYFGENLSNMFGGHAFIYKSF